MCDVNLIKCQGRLFNATLSCFEFLDFIESVAMIETAHLVLRAMRPMDMADLAQIFINPRVMRKFAVPFDQARMKCWLFHNLEHQRQFGYGLYSVVLKANGLLIGTCGLEQTDLNDRSAAELSYDFRRDYWDENIALEATCAVRNQAFQVLHLPGLVSVIRVGDITSRQVIERVGMKYVSKFTRYGHRYWLYRLLPNAVKQQINL